MLRKMLLLCVLGIPTSLAADSAPTLTITVTDELGAVISKASIWIHQDEETAALLEIPKMDDVTGRTDSVGHFTAKLAPGFYDVFVTATVFSPDCRKIRIRTDSPLSILFKLKLDPTVSKEIGGTMVE